MKKSFCIAVAALVLSALLAVFANRVAFAGGYDESYEDNGIALHYGDAFKNTKGHFYAFPCGCDYDYGVGTVVFWYLAMPEDVREELENKDYQEWTEAEEELYSTCHGELLEVVSVDGGRGLSDLMEMEAGMELEEDWFTEVGKAGDVTFFALTVPENTESYLENIDPVYQEEFKKLQKDLIKVLKKGSYSVPVIKGADLIGKTISFETTDVDGNTVKSEDIFKDNDITMINVWTTTCGACIGEMEELSRMSERMAEKNVEVVGVCLDAGAKLDKCRDIIEENGVTYQNLLPYDGMEEELEIHAFPTSFFVDSEGKILRLPFIGAPIDMAAYEEVIDGLLAGVETVPEETSAQTANDAGMYRVFVADEEGKPVEGAVVQFCSDSACTMAKTDKDGAAEFAAEEGTYTVHVLKAPAGYEVTDEEIKTDAVYSDVRFVLKKS